MKRSGTQSIERAILLLKEVSSRGSIGWRLSDLAQRCEMDVGTAHRILACLSKERLVHRRPSDRHYLPGPSPKQKTLIADNLRRVAHLGPARVRALEKMLKNSEQLGYAVHTGEIVPGVRAFGVPIFGPDGSAIASLGMSGEASALPPRTSERFYPAPEGRSAKNYGVVGGLLLSVHDPGLGRNKMMRLWVHHCRLWE